MSIIHLTQINSQIQKLFTGKIDLTDISAKHTDPKTIENFFLTRALAAYSVHYLAQASVDDSATAVVDGSDDNGIDAIYYDAIEKHLYVVQAKWIHNGVGEPELGDVKKFTGGIRDLFNLAFDRFNPKVAAKAETITDALTDPNTKYDIVLVYTGINLLSEHSRRDLDDLAAEMNDASELLDVDVLSQSDLYTSLTAGISGEPIDLDMSLKSWGKIETPHLGFYGQVDGAQIASWWGKYRTRLFTKNLRGVLGDTEVNEEIRRTIEKTPQLFWYFNNGVTIVSRKIVKAMAGGGDTAYGNFHCEDVSIVNGAQTVGTIGKHPSKDNVSALLVPIRVISLENSDDAFGVNVTKTNNRQNRIENRDFVTLDPEQNRIRTELAIDSIEYNLARTETATKGPYALDLVDSTTALACASGNVSLVVQLKREIGKLWENLEKAPYKEIFNPTTSGLFVWRCVQVQRMIDKALTLSRPSTGRGYGIAVHGNRLIALLVFRKVDAKQFASPHFKFESVTGELVAEETKDAYVKLRDILNSEYPNAIIPTLFKNLTKCKRLVSLASQ